MYISAAAKTAGHDCELAFGEALEEFTPVLEKLRPDLVGFSIMSGSHDWARKVAIEIKSRFGIANIFGGAHSTFFPQFAEEEGVYMIVRGEGEESVVDILERIDQKKTFDDVPNIGVRRDGKLEQQLLRNLRKDLDDYVFPDRQLYDALDERLDRTVRNVITSRDCPFHGSFRFEDAMRDLYKGKGKYVRIRDIDKVIQECKQLKDETDVRVIYFADDVFGMSKAWLYEFLPIYKREIGLEFVCLVRADIVASDEEYASRLAEGGYRSVFFGIESGNESLRNTVLKKDPNDDQIIRASELLHNVGITFRTYNIMGLPDETLDDALSTVELSIKIGADYPWRSIFSAFPGTALTDLAFKKGYLDEQFEYNSLSKSFFLGSNLELSNIRKIVNLQKFFQTAVLWPRTFPLVKRLIRIRPNRLFTWWIGLINFYVYVKSERRRIGGRHLSLPCATAGTSWSSSRPVFIRPICA